MKDFELESLGLSLRPFIGGCQKRLQQRPPLEREGKEAEARTGGGEKVDLSSPRVQVLAQNVNSALVCGLALVCCTDTIFRSLRARGRTPLLMHSKSGVPGAYVRRESRICVSNATETFFFSLSLSLSLSG